MTTITIDLNHDDIWLCEECGNWKTLETTAWLNANTLEPTGGRNVST